MTTSQAGSLAASALKAVITDIQRFSLHDGPGIRTMIFFKGCGLRCRWCQNPETIEARPIMGFYADRCQGSFACQAVCESNAIQMEGFRIIRDRCNLCGLCQDACAHNALVQIGQYTTPEELLEQVKGDLPYFRRSGGGITWSGGEPLLQSAFLLSFLNLAAEYRIHYTIETCGFFTMKSALPVLRRTDLIYFDLKIMDPAAHQDATGAGNNLIIENARFLQTEGFPVEFRMPVVPGITDNQENLSATIDLLLELGAGSIHLLPYHNMGEAKLPVVASNLEPLHLQKLPESRWKAIAEEFNRAGIQIKEM